MKNMKWIVPLAIVVLMLMIALPAAADDPFGGPPSRNSGNGTTTWAAIYIANTCSAKLTIPAGASRWFKFDTWKSVDTEVYVDDVPKFGAAYLYFNGQSRGVDNSQRIGVGDAFGHFPGGFQTKEQSLADYWGDVGAAVDNGFIARLYDGDYMQRMDFAYPVPNNALLTTRSGTPAFIGGVSRSLNGITGDRYSYLRHVDTKMADGETHLLSGRFHWDGWPYLKVYNAMAWDNDMMACTKYVARNDYDYPAGLATGSRP